MTNTPKNSKGSKAEELNAAELDEVVGGIDASSPYLVKGKKDPKGLKMGDPKGLKMDDPKKDSITAPEDVV